MDSCYVASEVALYASTSSKALPVDPGSNELAVDAFEHQFPAVNADYFQTKFTVSLLPTDDQCSNSVQFALYAKIQCNCSRAVCGASSRPQAAFAYTSAPLSNAERNVPAAVGFCCASSAAPSNQAIELSALNDNSDNEVVDMHAAQLLPKPVSPIAKRSAAAVELESSQQLHELHARQLDDEGTTGEVPAVISSTSSSSSSAGGDGTCPLPTPSVRVLSSTSVEVSVDASCGQDKRKRAPNDYSLELSQDSGDTYSTIYETQQNRFTHQVDDLTAGQTYSFRVCHNGACGAWISVTPGAAAASGTPTNAESVTGSNGNNSLALEPWLIGVIVAAGCLLIALIVVIVLIARRRRSKAKKQQPIVSADAAVPEPVLPQISISSDEEDDSFYLDRETGLQEEKRQRELNELLDQYKSHRQLKRKGTSGESSTGFSTSWDSDDEEEWNRLSAAATRIQAVWRGYAVRHPRTGARAPQTLTLSSAMSGFDILVEQLRAASYGSAEQQAASAAMLDLLERMQRAARALYADSDDDSVLPEDIAAAINALSSAVHALLNINSADGGDFEAAAAHMLKEKAALEALLAAVQPGLGAAQVEVGGRTRSWSAFKALLREYRGKKAALESQPDSQVAQAQLLEQFRTHAESLLPDDAQDTEESSATAEDTADNSMDSLSSRNPTGDWAQMKSLLQQYRAGRPAKEAAEAAGGMTSGQRERIQRGGDRWAEREAILARLEMHLTKAETDKDGESIAVISGVSRVPKPAIKQVEITPAQPLELDGAALPWVARETGSRNVKFEQAESDDESAEASADASGSSEMSSDMSAESASSTASGSSRGSSSSQYGVGSPLMRLAPVKFQKRLLRPRDASSSSEASSSGSVVRVKRGAVGLSGVSSRSSGSSRSAESSADVSYSVDDDVPAINVDALSKDASPRNSPRVLRRRVRQSGDGTQKAAPAAVTEEPEALTQAL